MGRARLFALSFFVCLPLGSAGSPPAPEIRPASGEELRYTVFLGGLRPVGSVVYRAESGGESVLTLEVSDRGRGQKLVTRLKLDRAGIPSRMRITGEDYWKNPVDERFDLARGRAVWSNASEKGEKRVSGRAFYVSLGGANQEIGLLAIALLRSPRGRLPLLPEGEARIESVGTSRIEAGGRSRTLSLYAISGLGFTPLYVWMESPRLFFGRYDGFVTVVRQGWEEVAPALIEAQAAAMAKREEALAAKLAHRPAGPLVVKGARLFDPETGKVLAGTTVVVSGNRVQTVGRDGEVHAPPGAEVLEAGGKMLLPGLWDMHQHFTATDGILDLAAGVTTGRDLANDTKYLLGLKSRWDSEKAVGPRVVLAGVIEGPGPYAGPTKVLVDTEERARAAVDRYAGLGYEQIKIYSSLDPKLVPAIVAEAHGRGLRVSGHIPYGMLAEQAVREGFDEIQHVNFLFLNFLPGVDTRTPARISAVAEHAAELDLASEPVRAFLRLLKERHTVVDPTVTAYEDKFTGRPNQVSPSLAAVADRLPYPVRRGLLGGNLPVPPGMEQRFRDSFRALLAMVRALHEAGITLVAGTDGPAGFTLHRELENYVAAGIPAPEVLRIATLGAARVMKRDSNHGTVAPGKLADFILVDGDPTLRIGDIRRVVVTVKDGVVFNTAELWQAIGVMPVR
ncbi:MAG TPA: amidohydrolase family protein [Thermoanaerobaculia bacterium]|nr:amidohydrolase family protein [Thermoanaerobaculia bacterium]